MGVTMLLWRCPFCGRNDALRERRSWRGPRTLACTQCGGAWRLERVIGDDYYLEVMAGPVERMGQRASLAAWYREMKAGLKLEPISADGLALAPTEPLYLQATGIRLVVNVENPLLDGWVGPDPPRTPPATAPPRLAWRSLGRGRLYLTGERLAWRGRELALDFAWRHVNSVFWFLSTLGIMYGTLTYRFNMGQEHVLKWLTYAGLVAPSIRERYGHVVSVSYY